MANNRVAVIELKNALQKDASLAPARALLGEMHFIMGDFPSALKELERAVDLGHEDIQSELTLLRAKIRLGRYSEVIGALEERDQLAPEFAVVLGQAYLQGGDQGTRRTDVPTGAASQ